MNNRHEILRMLSDGAFHSGTDLGKHLGISRAAVCKNIQQLSHAGLVVHRVTGRGYKIETPLTLLDRVRILKALGQDAGHFRDRLHLLDEVDSTSLHLASLTAGKEDINGMVCLAETQTRGRGRRGRQWIATPYSNILMSMAWRFPGGPTFASGLSLAAGVALVQALEEYGISGIGLKWPNDLLWEHRKLAGLLIDIQGEATGPSHIILGMGINGHISRRDAARIDQPWVDLQSIVGEAIDRNRLTALIMRRLYGMFEVFASKGLSPFREEWQRRHLFHGQRVSLIQGDREFSGTAEGIDEIGGLVIRHARSRHVFHSGEVSLRSSSSTR